MFKLFYIFIGNMTNLLLRLAYTHVYRTMSVDEQKTLDLNSYIV